MTSRSSTGPLAQTDPDSTAAPAATMEGERLPSQRLRYVTVPAPAPGRAVEVAPGILWARIPMPGSLDHINVWLLDTPEGYVLVDTGMPTALSQAAWGPLRQEVLAKKPLCAIFITHMHTDHSGLAYWLQRTHQVPVLMSQRTHEILARSAEGGPFDPSPFLEFLRKHGVPDLSLFKPYSSESANDAVEVGVPTVERYVTDGMELSWSGSVQGARTWTALETGGHAEGHLCLLDAANRVLICGDQVLPTISPNIGLGMRSNDRNPLRTYLDSLQRLRQQDAGTLVLPSHGVPFYGLHERIDDLTRHHGEHLERLVQACATPKTTFEILPVMYRRELKGFQIFMAMSEALSHLEYLVDAQRLERLKDAADKVRYRALECAPPP